jgi:hypothetical protein
LEKKKKKRDAVFVIYRQRYERERETREMGERNWRRRRRREMREKEKKNQRNVWFGGGEREREKNNFFF